MIKSEKFVIKAIEKDDIDIIYQWSNESFRGEYQEFKFTSKQELLKQFENGELFSDKFQMLIIESYEKVPIGLIYLNFIRDGLVVIGVVLSFKMRNAGIGKQVTKDITKYIFDNYTTVRIQAETDALNIPAQKVLEAAGFIREGLMRNYRFHHGKYNDSVLYSLIR